MNHLIRLYEIRFLKAGPSEPKLSQNIEKPPRVIRRGPDKNIQVAGVTWTPMKSQALRTDDDIINVAGILQFEKLSPVFVQGHGSGAPPESANVRCPTVFCKNHGPLYQPQRNYGIFLLSFPRLNYRLGSEVFRANLIVVICTSFNAFG